VNRVDEALANLDQMRSTAIGVAGISGVVLAVLSGGPWLRQALLLGSVSAAMLALLPRLGGSHGVVAWARGEDGADDGERLRWVAGRTVTGWRLVRVSVALFLAGMGVGVVGAAWSAVTG
jgi:hypothetical protein